MRSFGERKEKDQGDENEEASVFGCNVWAERMGSRSGAGEGLEDEILSESGASLGPWATTISRERATSVWKIHNQQRFQGRGWRGVVS